MIPRAFWSDRSPNERALIGAIVIVVALAVFIAFVWLPLDRSRARLATQLPQLRASIAALERDAEEAKRLRTFAPTAPPANEPLASLATAGGGRPLPGVEITVPDGKSVSVSGADVSYGALLEWIAQVQASQGMHVERARIEALPAPGRVKVQMLLTRAAPLSLGRGAGGEGR
jgi:general secretion pathway protein M